MSWTIKNDLEFFLFYKFKNKLFIFIVIVCYSDAKLN